MKTIVVPTDLSTDTDKALSVAVTLARADEARIVLLHSVMYPVPADVYPGGSAVVADYILHKYRRMEDEARQAMDRMIHNPDYAGVTIMPVLATNRQGLASNVTDQPADLIVMSSAGSSGLADWLIGSNAEVIVRYARCPVLVIKEPVAHFDPQHIVYAIDLDERLREVRTYPFKMGKDGWHQLLYILTPTDSRLVDGIREWADEVAHASGIANAELVMRHAQTVPDGIIEYADAAKADLVVTFTHGHTGLRHLLTGSVAEDVLNRSGTPVLVMRA